MIDTRDRDIDILARTIWAEARSEFHLGRVAVGCVVRNRAQAVARGDASAKRFGKGYDGVCRHPWQFSCWNDGDPNRAKLLAVDETDRDFAECKLIAAAVIDGRLPDVTFGSDHYCSIHAKPTWATGQTPVGEIGRHRFFNDIP